MTEKAGKRQHQPQAAADDLDEPKEPSAIDDSDSAAETDHDEPVIGIKITTTVEPNGNITKVFS